jgi:proteic killer suppression protein
MLERDSESGPECKRLLIEHGAPANGAAEDVRGLVRKGQAGKGRPVSPDIVGSMQYGNDTASTVARLKRDNPDVVVAGPLLLDVNNDSRYHCGMILSFECSDTEALFGGRRVKRFVNIEGVAMRKLQQLHAATTLEFMRVPPGNRLEALSGDRKGQHSIRINDQWRVCFVWADGHAHRVEITDYH